jgi:hypothetical protein
MSLNPDACSAFVAAKIGGASAIPAAENERREDTAKVSMRVKYLFNSERYPNAECLELFIHSFIYVS